MRVTDGLMVSGHNVQLGSHGVHLSKPSVYKQVIHPGWFRLMIGLSEKDCFERGIWHTSTLVTAIERHLRVGCGFLMPSVVKIEVAIHA